MRLGQTMKRGSPKARPRSRLYSSTPIPRSSPTFGWGQRLGDRFAGSADELLAHVLDHLPLAGDELQHLGHVLADPAWPAIATTWAGRRHRIDNALPSQVLRQRPARR